QIRRDPGTSPFAEDLVLSSESARKEDDGSAGSIADVDRGLVAELAREVGPRLVSRTQESFEHRLLLGVDRREDPDRARRCPRAAPVGLDDDDAQPPPRELTGDRKPDDAAADDDHRTIGR